jgi:hypothetical protein
MRALFESQQQLKIQSKGLKKKTTSIGYRWRRLFDCTFPLNNNNWIDHNVMTLQPITWMSGTYVYIHVYVVLNIFFSVAVHSGWAILFEWMIERTSAYIKTKPPAWLGLCNLYRLRWDYNVFSLLVFLCWDSYQVIIMPIYYRLLHNEHEKFQRILYII